MSVTLHTSLGDVKLELFCAQAPKLCENFLALAASGTYDNTLFHRNIAGFIIQGGDPTHTGKGGTSIHGVPLADEFGVDLSHDKRGVVSMANNGPNTNNSQFFITYQAANSLDGKYSVIGNVLFGPGTESTRTLNAMEGAPVSGKKHKPVTEIVIQRVTIHANPFATR